MTCDGQPVDMSMFYPSQTSLVQFTHPGGMQGLVSLGKISEPGPWYRSAVDSRGLLRLC